VGATYRALAAPACRSVGRMTTRRFRMIDVFPSATPRSGNPLAVVLDAEGLTTAQMAAFSAWTNLSECTFVLPPTDPAADYRMRIFSLTTELPFAGHPTLGTARAWLDAGGVPRHVDNPRRRFFTRSLCIFAAKNRLHPRSSTEVRNWPANL